MSNLATLTNTRKVSLGDILKAAMEDKGLGTRELAYRIGGNCRRQYLQSILKGRIEPTVNMLEKICAALDAA